MSKSLVKKHRFLYRCTGWNSTGWNSICSFFQRKFSVPKCALTAVQAIPEKKNSLSVEKRRKSLQICQENIDFITDALFRKEIQPGSSTRYSGEKQPICQIKKEVFTDLPKSIDLSESPVKKHWCLYACTGWNTICSFAAKV